MYPIYSIRSSNSSDSHCQLYPIFSKKFCFIRFTLQLLSIYHFIFYTLKLTTTTFFFWYFSIRYCMSFFTTFVTYFSTSFKLNHQQNLTAPDPLGLEAATYARYCITFLVFSVLPAPDSPVQRMD